MIRKVPLYAKILGWFFLNLAAIGVASWLLLRDQFRFSALPARTAGDHVERVAAEILAEALPRPIAEWDGILASHSAKHRVQFRILSGEARPIAGPRDPLPPEVHGRLFGTPRGEPQGPRRGSEGGPPGERRPPRGGPPGGPRSEWSEREDWGEPGRPRPPRGAAVVPHQVVVQSTNPDRYWVIVQAAQPHPAFRNGGLIAASSDSPTGNGFYFDVRPYVWWGAGVLGLSVLIWFPFVRGLTTSISRMRNATANLAEGKFDTRVDERRRDEVGELGREINRMACRLAGYLNGQKRFLGDVAHELSAPTARLQMALAILEQRAASDEDRERVGDAREEAEHMGGLVDELLQFSRASVNGRKVQLQPVDLRAVAEKAIRREAADTSQVVVEIPAGLLALGDHDLLLRAVSNLLRNAIRYAGHAGRITARGERSADGIRLSIEDRGPGIPAAELPRIFEPFYRPDTARTPGTGGAGLGLAIVATCVQACGGTVVARNLTPGGLAVTITLSPAE